MILIPFDKTQKAGYVFANNEGSITQSPTDLITEYNTQKPEQRANLVDLHIAAQWTARVYKTSVTFSCNPTSAATSSVALPAGETAVSLIYPDGYARDKYTVQLTTESGKVLDIGCANRQAFVKASNVQLDQNYLRVQKANNQVFGLTADGHLFQIDGQRSTPVSTALDGSLIEIVPQQRFEFYE
jgi:hypothetical protein